MYFIVSNSDGYQVCSNGHANQLQPIFFTVGSLPTAVVDEDNIIMIPAIASDMLSNKSDVTSEKSQTPPPPLPPKP